MALHRVPDRVGASWSVEGPGGVLSAIPPCPRGALEGAEPPGEPAAPWPPQTKRDPEGCP